MRLFYFAAIAAGIIALVYVFRNFGTLGNPQAPLNASGYTYPSSPGA